MGTFRAKFEQYTVSGDPIPPDDGVCFWLDKRQVVDDCASTGGGPISSVPTSTCGRKLKMPSADSCRW